MTNWAGMVTGCVAFGFVNHQAPRTCNKEKKKAGIAATYHQTTPRNLQKWIPHTQNRGGGCLTHRKPRKSGAGDADIAILSPATSLAPAAKNGQNFKTIHIFSNISSNHELKTSEMNRAPSKWGGGYHHHLIIPKNPPAKN